MEKMKKADYGIISKTYDKNEDRLHIDKDLLIGELHPGKIRILDLACGTGNYLQKQKEYYSGSDIEWYGLDLSKDMLAIAGTKTSGVTFVQAGAEEAVFEEFFFDYIVCNFAFHHFEDKNAVLDQIHRILKSDGAVKFTNVCPEVMKKWWVYRYCPETYVLDLSRFWDKDKIVLELEKRQFRTFVEIKYQENYRDIEKIITDYERRDNSQLSIVDDQSYQRGLEKLKKEAADGIREIRNYFGMLEIIGRKQDVL